MRERDDDDDDLLRDDRALVGASLRGRRAPSLAPLLLRPPAPKARCQGTSRPGARVEKLRAPAAPRLTSRSGGGKGVVGVGEGGRAEQQKNSRSRRKKMPPWFARARARAAQIKLTLGREAGNHVGDLGVGSHRALLCCVDWGVERADGGRGREVEVEGKKKRAQQQEASSSSARIDPPRDAPAGPIATTTRRPQGRRTVTCSTRGQGVRAEGRWSLTGAPKAAGRRV